MTYIGELISIGVAFSWTATALLSEFGGKRLGNLTLNVLRMGRVKGNRMVKMQLTNEKLIDRGTRMIQESLGITYDEARQRLLEAGSVDKVIS